MKDIVLVRCECRDSGAGGPRRAFGIRGRRTRPPNRTRRPGLRGRSSPCDRPSSSPGDPPLGRAALRGAPALSMAAPRHQTTPKAWPPARPACWPASRLAAQHNCVRTGQGRGGRWPSRDRRFRSPRVSRISTEHAVGRNGTGPGRWARRVTLPCNDLRHPNGAPLNTSLLRLEHAGKDRRCSLGGNGK